MICAWSTCFERKGWLGKLAWLSIHRFHFDLDSSTEGHTSLFQNLLGSSFLCKHDVTKLDRISTLSVFNSILMNKHETDRSPWLENAPQVIVNGIMLNMPRNGSNLKRKKYDKSLIKSLLYLHVCFCFVLFLTVDFKSYVFKSGLYTQ